MIDLKRILLPTDFSDFSKITLDYACGFAEKFGAELHVLHVLQDLVAAIPEPGLAFPPPGDYMVELEQSAREALTKFVPAEWAAGHTVVHETRQGAPFVEIVRYAREKEVDMIVMGTHGRTGLVHVLLGSVAEKVVRKAPCPVLTIRPIDHKFEMP